MCSMYFEAQGHVLCAFFFVGFGGWGGIVCGWLIFFGLFFMGLCKQALRGECGGGGF